MTKLVVLFTTLFLIGVSSFSAGRGGDQDVVSSQAHRITQIDSILLSLCSGSPETFKQRFGTPTASKSEDFINPHDQSRDKIASFTYRSASVRLYHDIETSRFLTISLELRTARWFKSIGLDGGTTEWDVRSQLGEPTQSKVTDTKHKVLTYTAKAEAENTIEFWFTRGHLTKVVYYPYIE